MDSEDKKNLPVFLFMVALVVIGAVAFGSVTLTYSFFMAGDLSPGTFIRIMSVIYNFAIPGFLFYLSRRVLSKRFSTYGEMSIDEKIPSLKKYRKTILNVGSREIKLSPLVLSLLVCAPFIFISMIPLMFPFFLDYASLTDNESWFNRDSALNFKFLDYKSGGNEVIKEQDGEFLTVGSAIGPYGLGATVLSFFLPLGLGLGFGLYNFLRSRKLIKIASEAQALEEEFASSLFQLGNMIGNGFPVETAVEKVAASIKGSSYAEFFSLINSNIAEKGMDVEKAIFDEKQGALAKFPSPVIEGSMRVLIESYKEGPMQASSSLISLSEYLKNVRATAKMRDLTDARISGIKRKAGFLLPMIAAVVVGITSMIINSLNNLQDQIQNIVGQTEGYEAAAGLLNIFGAGIPTYYFQAIIGVYVIQLIYIMVLLTNRSKSGSGKLKETYVSGTTLLISSTIYSLIACALTILLTIFLPGSFLL